jgi:hypothetical protein
MVFEVRWDMVRLLSVSANWPNEPSSHPGITAAAAINPNCVSPVFRAEAGRNILGVPDQEVGK